MRQTQIGAWLFMTVSLIAACSGEAFSPTDQDDSHESIPTGNKAGAGRSSVGGAATSTGGASSKPQAGSSSAGSPAAGSPGSGGTSTGTGGGGPTSGGGSNDDCATGSVKFTMLPGPNVPPDYLCNAGCGTGWLTITDQLGATAFSIFPACGTASCEACEPLPCAAGICLPTPLSAEGSHLVWNGTYLSQDTCGSNMACQRQACMPAGKYKAKACVAISAGEVAGGGCQPKDDDSLCTEVEFDFPEATEVKLVLDK